MSGDGGLTSVCKWEGVSATLVAENIMAVWAHYGALARGASLNNAWPLLMSRVQMSSEEH